MYHFNCFRESESRDVKDTDEEIHRIIIDCSTFTFVDMSGLETLLEVCIISLKSWIKFYYNIKYF